MKDESRGARTRWSIVGQTGAAEGRLRQTNERTAELVTLARAGEGDELRLELHEETGGCYAVLRDLGSFEGPALQESFRLPETALGKVLGKLFRVFGRG